MTRRMQLIAGGVIIVALALVAAVVASTPGVEAQPRRDPDPRPVCVPDDVWLKPGWPTWTVCADSNGFHTCWRPQDHTGRHCEWDLATGKVTAVWPCTQRRAITRWRAAA